MLLKNSLKVFTSYIMALTVFLVFLPAPLSLSKDNSLFWFLFYCYLMFTLMTLLIFSDMKKLAEKERKPEYNLKPHPLKGLLMGVIGFVPFIAVELVYPFIAFQNVLADKIKYLVFNGLLGPLYGFINLGGESPAAYILASAAVPVIAMLGYMAGYWGIDLKALVKKSGGGR